MKTSTTTACCVLVVSSLLTIDVAMAAGQWREDVFPPPNGGKLVFSIAADGSPACASYDGQNCLWGQSIGDIDFGKVRPLACGAPHRKLYGVTGFEDPSHWCNLAKRGAGAPAAVTPRPAAAYRMTNWSGWGRAAGVDYRYRVGWDPAASGPGKTVDAIYQVRNAGSRGWSGAARSLDCDKDTLFGSTNVAVAAGRTAEVRVRAPNCGNAANPQVRPNIVRAGKID
jgi:hypothetical protein